MAASSHVAEICGVEMNEWIRLEIGVSKKEPLPLDGDGPMCMIMLCIPISGCGVTVLPPPTKCILSYKDWGGESL